MPRPPPPVHWGNKFGAKNKGKKRFALPIKQRRRLAALEAALKLFKPVDNPRVTLALTNPYKVAPGQLWVNVDERAGKHWKAGAPRVRVIKVRPPYAICYWATEDGTPDPSGKMSTIRLDMFRAAEPRKTRWGGGNRGWRLKEESVESSG